MISNDYGKELEARFSHVIKSIGRTMRSLLSLHMAHAITLNTVTMDRIGKFCDKADYAGMADAKELEGMLLSIGRLPAGKEISGLVDLLVGCVEKWSFVYGQRSRFTDETARKYLDL